MKKKPLVESPYKVIAKVGNNEDKTAKVVSYKTNNLVSTFNFLTKTYPGFTWMNVYDRIGNKGQLANFTKNNPPTSTRLKIR